MMLTPTTKWMLFIGLVAVVSLVIMVGYTKTVSKERVAIDRSPATEVVEYAEPAVLEMIKLQLQPIGTTEGTSTAQARTTYRLILGSQGKRLNALSLRFELTEPPEPATIYQVVFELDPELERAGWQVAIAESVSARDAEAVLPRYELSLINSQPSGGTVFTSDTLIGSVTALSTVVLSLDPAVSMAASTENEQLGVELVQQQ